MCTHQRKSDFVLGEQQETKAQQHEHYNVEYGQGIVEGQCTVLASLRRPVFRIALNDPLSSPLLTHLLTLNAKNILCAALSTTHSREHNRADPQYIY